MSPYSLFLLQNPILYYAAITHVHQNNNGFNVMIGGFGGLLLGGVTTKSIFDFNDNDSSIKGFITVITSSVIGALIGYNNETTLTYSFPHKKNLNGLVSEEIISKKQLLALRTVSW